MKDKLQRKSARLKGYDYSQNGCYFITICTENRKCLFGDVVDGEMRLNGSGEVANQEILRIASHYAGIETKYFTVMPNHVHFIIAVGGSNATEAGAASGAPTSSMRTTIGNVVRGYKSGVSRNIGFSPWQRNYHDHIIRNEQSFQKIAVYIESNPVLWREDCFYQQ